MEIRDHYGLALAVVGPEELAARPWARPGRDIDVVRVVDPPATFWPELGAHGFLRKPSAVAWVAELGSGEEEFLSRLRRTARRDIRRAQRDAAAAGLTEVIEEPVSPAALDRFLALYADRVAQMDFGVPFALGHRDAVLDGPDKFFGVFAYAGEELAGGCLVRECPDDDAAVVRFSAVTAEWRRSSLARVLYLTALRVARSKGYRWATLGNEPNLIGHLTKPGLFRFKADLGFRTVPSQDFADPDGHDEADLVLRLDRLNDPTFLLAYADPVDAAERRLAGHLFCVTPQDTAPYAAPFLISTSPTLPAGHRCGAAGGPDRTGPDRTGPD
ncbi:GNAT family N-acetyltransferase [Streptomyces meridianus]|uniref:GNAT family N-acetyltransferase n=1 Tax=Streptomyces meridianus TaxID=2938945 RepID=A0ABT0X9Z0_9ACTN|nr:GNAT family N-acetyltransferase [Streptomyces meridianus]MCM2578733.1 GNAT family N-acetyltransferase [Streptomyces meridianus]